jgi:glycosyltransferase involved in cell wall biosynthesis
MHFAAFKMKSPNILYLTSQPPYPLTSGFAIRNLHLLRAYANWGRVELVFFYSDELELDAAQELRSQQVNLHPVPVTSTRQAEFLADLPRWQRGLRLVLTSKPSMITYLFSPEMARRVEALAASADVVHVTPLPMVAQVDHLLRRGRKRSRFVLDLPDLEPLLEARRLRFADPPLTHRVFGYYDIARAWAYQAWAVRAFDRVFVCSAQERALLRSRHVLVVPNGSEVPAELPPSGSDGRTLLFCGSLSSGANRDGLAVLVRSILPEIWKEMTDVRLVIVGRQPPSWVRALHDGKRILVEGDVASVAEYYHRATIAVVPLRVGGGTRLKILEAWALGVPVVSTRIGCEGLEAVHGQHLLKADDPREFARSCLTLLRDSATRLRLIESGRAVVARQYCWETIASDAVRGVRELVENASMVVSGQH